MHKFLVDENGATAIEYGLIAALIAVAIIASLSTLGQTVSDNFEAIAESIDNSAGGGSGASGGAGGSGGFGSGGSGGSGSFGS
jgi:pilus assembly protein Flp/PilA